MRSSDAIERSSDAVVPSSHLGLSESISYATRSTRPPEYGFFATHTATAGKMTRKDLFKAHKIAEATSYRVLKPKIAR